MRVILWLSTTDLIQLTVLAIGGILLTDTIFYKKINMGPMSRTILTPFIIY